LPRWHALTKDKLRMCAITLLWQDTIAAVGAFLQFHCAISTNMLTGFVSIVLQLAQ
jgi:hypothetical protein